MEMIKKDSKVKRNYNLNESTVFMLDELHKATKFSRSYIIERLIEDCYKNNLKKEEVAK